MNAAADQLWTRLQATLAEGMKRLLLLQPEATCEIGKHSNDAFSFRAYASLGLRNGEVERVVISADSRRDGESLRCSADIALADGRLLAVADDLIGPAHQVDVLFERWANELDSFILANIPTLARALA